MILITSAAYVDPQFRNEFGLLPPAFLPVGNKRLFEHQIEIINQQFPCEKIYLTVPDSYTVGLKDLNYLNSKNIALVKIDEALSLATSIGYAVSQIASEGSKLRILHGDTLLGSFPGGLDIVAVANTVEDYLWEIEDVNLSSEVVWCGYFAFSDPLFLLECLGEREINFVKAIKKYSEKKPLQRVHVNTWSDFGHINTYFQSRAKVTTERAFNQLKIEGGCVYKSGDDDVKIKAESAWFRNLPTPLRIYSPQLIDFGINQLGKNFYVLEYLAITPLNEIFVHGSNPPFYWDKLFELCFDFLKACKSVGSFSDSFISGLSEFHSSNKNKTIDRLEIFFKQNKNISWKTELFLNGKSVGTPHLMLYKCLELADKIPVIPGILHGDLCLSNILFDSRTDRIKVIDPRGLDGFGCESNFGNLTYDLAKLAHSIIGLYDYIIAGAYALDFRYGEDAFYSSLNIYIDKREKEIQSIFSLKRFDVISTPIEVMPLTILLFLSMLPLHSDNPNRQLALLSNAMRLYSSYILKEPL